MAGHSSEKRWDKNQFGDVGVGQQVRDAANRVVGALADAEELYQDLLELWQFAGGTDQLMADQLFLEVWSARTSGSPPAPETQANAAEVLRVADARAAMQAIHDLYEAMTNVAVTQQDRIAVLRRMT